MGKTVYILGAGFSKGAGAPLQSEIINNIFALTKKDLQGLNYQKLFFSYRKDLNNLLSEVLFIDERDFKNFSLEDIYSIMDRCLLDNLSLRKLGKVDLIELRNKINALIVMLMDFKLKENSIDSYVQTFANYLVKKRIHSFGLNEENDPFAIISTNWDIVLENALQSKIEQSIYELQSGQHTKFGFIDYCFYVHAYDELEFGKKLRSGQYWRGKGFYNIKVLKLHGSMNWLQCQKCQRVFITFFNKIALEQFISKPICNHCKNNFINEGGAQLLSVLIMPTFLKDLNIFQLKLSWQIAGIELQEASKIVFMGYSFPMADFEFRQLLARSVKQNAEIDVVLHSDDELIKGPGTHKINDFLPETRYKAFFGKRRINFFYKGVEKYIMDNCIT